MDVFIILMVVLGLCTQTYNKIIELFYIYVNYITLKVYFFNKYLFTLLANFFFFFALSTH